MRTISFAAALAAAFFSASAVYAAPPAEAFGALPLAKTGRLSPDGKHLALIQPVNGRSGVMIYDLTSPTAKPHAVALEGAVAENLFWKTNDRLIAIFAAHLKQKFSRDIYAWSRAVSVDANGQNAVLLLRDSAFLKYNLGTSIVDPAPADPWHVYIAAWSSNADTRGETSLRHEDLALNLFRVNVVLGYGEMVKHGQPHTIQYITDGQGGTIATIERDSNLKNHVMIGNKDVLSYDVSGGKGLDFVGLTAGPEPTLVVRTSDSSGMQSAFAWSSTAGMGSALFSDHNHDLDDTIEDERTWRIIGIRYTDDLLRSRYFDPALQRVQTALEKAFPGQSVMILSKDDAGASYLIRTDGPRNAPVLYLYTPANRQVNIVQEAYPSLKSADLGEVRPYPYKARDGLDIHAYLTLPPGKDPRNLPTVIFPHGGPEDRDSMNFNWWAQFMASRGYAVLQPNYRGSSGYGWNFVKAGDGEWAGKVQYDIQDGVQKLVDDGIADPKRICIVGASWGGYLALGGASFSPDLYACAISFAGPADLAHDIYEGTTFESEVHSVWVRRFGAEHDSGKIAAQSPINFADRVKIPILLIHSDKDVTVKIDQSEMEERALKRAGKEVEFVKLEGEDHYLEFADTRIKLLKEIERFLAAHIGDKPVAEKQAN